ncbi:hypothetical protein HYT02_01165 [Candidatus Gottesmanbacteria bacterium]|nr:hypothetical protein [Candidatus Gottesmanbacteria bacterium]
MPDPIPPERSQQPVTPESNLDVPKFLLAFKKEMEEATGKAIEEDQLAKLLTEALVSAREGARERAPDYSVRAPQIRQLEKGKIGEQLLGGILLDAVPRDIKIEIERIISVDLKDFDQARIEQLLRKPWSDDHSQLFQILDHLKEVIGSGRQMVKNTDEVGALSQLDAALNSVNEWSRQLVSGLGRNELGAVSFSLNGYEIGKIVSGLEGAREMFEVWVSAIEARDKMSHEDVNQGLLNRFWTAAAWFSTLDYTDERYGSKENVEKLKNALINEFRTRLELHNMKQAMANTEEQVIIQESMRIGSATIFEGFRISKAEIAVNLYQRLFERYRFRYGSVEEVWSEKDFKLVKRIQKIEGKDGFVKVYDDDKKDFIVVKGKEDDDQLKAQYLPKGVALDRITQAQLPEIRNAVQKELVTNYHMYGFSNKAEALTADKVGFNVFRASMRMAVHVSKARVNRAAMESDKGYRELRKENTFESDLDEVLVNQYNPWQYSIEKWYRMGRAKYAIFKRVMELMGDGDVEVGHQKVINALSIPDYFSSGWRIQTVFEALEKRLVISEIAKEKSRLGKTELNGEETDRAKKAAKARMATLATGLKMQWKKEDEKKEAAGMVAKYRPLELVKAYAVNYNERGNPYSSGAQQKKFQDMLKTKKFDIAGIEIRDYIRLEEVLGKYIYPIYEKAMNPIDEHGHFDWRSLEGIDIANPKTEAHKAIINQVVSLVNENNPEYRLEVDELKLLYRKVQEFVSSKDTIDDIVDNKRNDQMHHKTLFVDDAPLGAMEEQMINPDGIDLPKISKTFFETEGGRRDPYARMWGDTFTATQAQTHMWNAMDARDHAKLTEELAGVASTLVSYGGRDPYMYLSAHIGAGWLDFARADMTWGTIGLANKVPWATSKFERLFGLAAPAMSREEVKGVWERLKLGLGEYKYENETAEQVDKKMTGLLGLQKWKLGYSMLKSIALIALVAMMQAILKEQENIDEA